jgi:hypothetical protein
MATYKEIKGVTIQTRDEDPTINAGTWASSTSANLGREELGAGGTATAAIIFGGQQLPPVSPRTRAETETWNGSAWTEVGDLNTVKKNQAGAGTPSTALSSSGQDPSNDNSPLVEQWNGSAWTEVAEVNTARRQLAGAGVSGTAALIFNGFDGSRTLATESWNGSAWTEVNDTNEGGVRRGSFGTYTSAVTAGGGDPGSIANSETWNGTSWTETNDLNTARKDMSSHGSGGSSTDGLIFAGYTTTNIANTESWNGTSWTEVNDLSTAFRNGFGSQQGSSISAIAGLGTSTTLQTQVEEWSFPSGPHLNEGDIFLSGGTTLKGAVKASSPSTVWASGGNTNTDRGYGFAFGPQTAAQMAAGEAPPRVTVSEQYDGTSWTEVNDTNHAGGAQARAGSGTQTAATIAGFAGASTPYGHAETWNGSSWSETAELNTTKYSRASTLTSGPAAVVFGGTSPATADTETFDGTSWSEVNNLNASKYAAQGVGSPTAGMNIGGYEPGGYTVNVESWNGTSWTEGTNTNSAQGYGGAAGASSSNAVKFGGSGGPTGLSAITELWNGSSWTEIGDLSTSYTGNIGTGSSAAALNIPGKTAPTTYPGACEEFTGDVTLQTITVS